MPQFTLGEADELFYQHEPAGEDKATFAFFNAITGETAMWATKIAPALKAQGYGTLLFNYRGQKNSPVSDDVRISAHQITSDCKSLIESLAIPKLVTVGLSIGGYFGVRAHLQGASVAGHVLLNTLREDSPRLAWINDATYRAVLTGGGALIRDLYAPLLFNEGWQAHNRQSFLTDAPYEPLSADHIDARLMAAGGTADWNISWEDIRVPVEVVTGTQDRVFRNEEVIAKIMRRLPDALATDLSDCGHMVPIEQPDAVISVCERIAGRIK